MRKKVLIIILVIIVIITIYALASAGVLLGVKSSG